MGEVPVVMEPSSATRCCPVIKCQCQVECYIPTCDDNRPPMLLEDSKTECCPEYQCPPPPTPPPPPCRNVTCAPEPTCGKNEYKIQLSNEDPCCTSFTCIPLPTTPAPPASVTPCESSGCPPVDCKAGENAVEMPSSENPCCPSYTCIPPSPSTTPSAVSTTTVPECHGIACTPVPVCLRNGERAVQVPTFDRCCPAYKCQCDLCPSAPYCGDMQPTVNFNLDTECCPIYECPIPTTQQPTLPETTTPALPTPPPPCLNVLCPPVTCTKMGAVPVVMEPSSATRCCPVIECQCQVECYIPTCDDNRPPLLLGDSKTECCPEYKCPPPPTPPPPPCRHVTCAPDPTCRKNEYKIQSPTEDPCCKAVFCIPIPTTPAPPASVTPCESSGCPPADCKDGEKAVEMPSSDNSCCPSYTCITPSPPPTTPSAVTTTPVPACHGITCTPVPACLRNGERAVQVSTSDICCPAYECQCDPCLPAPYCGGRQPIVNFNLDTECCPIYECPSLTTPQPPPASTAPPTPPPPTPPPPCLNVLCPPVTCTKMGAVPVVMEPSSATRCCPVIECQCQEKCYIPTCDDNRPPLLLGNPETECCPEHQCPPPPTPPPPPCRHVTCAPEPACKENEYKIQSPTDDPCCRAIFCIPKPTTPAPSTSVTPCESSGCPPADCKVGEKAVEMPSSENSCCPSYKCIPPTPSTTPPGISTTLVPRCQGITCNVPVCLRNGEKAVQVPTSDPCCPAYECQCDPCPSAPYCGDKQPIVNFKLEAECCPIYECPPPTPITPPPPSTPEHTTPKTTVIIASTTHGCKDRNCPVKQCKDFENLVTHFNPKDPCCPQQTCECTCKTIPSCDSDERLVAVRQNNQCCPKLKCERKKDECHPVNTAVNLQSGHCSANVILATCSGYCHSKTEYNSLWAPVSQCRCCSVTSTHPKNFELSCKDGSRAHITVQEASQCGCRHCSDDGGSGDGSGSGSEDDGSGFSLWSNFQEKN